MSVKTWWELHCDSEACPETFGPVKHRAIEAARKQAHPIGWRHGYRDRSGNPITGDPIRKLDFCPMHQDEWRGW